MPLLDPLSSVAASLRKHNIIPDVIPAGFTPSTLFSVAWGDKEAMLGNALAEADTQSEPRVQLAPMGACERGGAAYTLAMLDPDADPKFGPFRHWLISGLTPPTPGEVIAAASVERELLEPSTKPAITPYRPPAPGPGTGMHRYVFLLFQEPPEGYTLAPDSPEFGSELRWAPMEFAKRHNLTLVGANYFTMSN